VLAGVGLAGLVGVLAACSSGGDSAGSDPNGVVAKSEIPVGGGKIFSDRKVVVTQPEAGTYKGFSAICTHMGCTVDQVAGGTINCPCHGSKFSVKDGSVVNGPATASLPSARITVKGNDITLA
jgi:Rieske Fe-S protein